MNMKEKKIAVMTIRMTPGTKRAIEREAERHDWTPSKMAEKILSAWARQQEGHETESAGKDTSVESHDNEIETIHIQ